jgi:hypothetical protein
MSSHRERDIQQFVEFETSNDLNTTTTQLSNNNSNEIHLTTSAYTIDTNLSHDVIQRTRLALKDFMDKTTMRSITMCEGNTNKRDRSTNTSPVNDIQLIAPILICTAKRFKPCE